MMPTSRTEESIFAEALEKASPAERAAFLAAACGDDAPLRARAEQLLESHEAAGSFLRKPPAPLPTSSYEPITESSGTVIGPYKLLQSLGEGGMGAVWIAEQTQPVKRRVALKIIKAGMDSDQVLRRFEAERQALALMDHTNIAKVLDAGTTNAGRPYFVMELIPGVPITQYCDELNLPIRERLALFVPVCQAIQHAHQKGVIHRDIKPSNVLVSMQDGKPVPKVIDFGVAKALHQQLGEHSLYTEFGAVIGTLEYMSPEQAEMSVLGVDTRADVYALGVLLYELLTGSTPLDKERLRTAAYGEMIRIIKEEEPPKPSTKLSQSKQSLASLAALRRTDPARLVKQIRVELDWVVMKCLEKDRGRRYESASNLARDIERYLHDEPVEACPPSPGYRLKKFLRKHRAAAMATAAVVVAGVLAVAGQTVNLIRAKHAEADAARARDAAVLAEERAVAAAREEQRAKDDALAAQRAETEARKRAERERDAKDQALVRAEGLRLTAQSSAELHTDPGLGLLLAIEAARVAPSKEANNALFAALDTCREERTLFGHSGEVLSARFTPDSQRIISCAKDSTVRLWSAESGKQLMATPDLGYFGRNLMDGVVLSPDGKYFVTLYCGIAHFDQREGRPIEYTDRVVRLWDAATATQLAVLRGHQARVRTAAFSADSQLLVTASDDTTARVWEIPSGQQLAVLEGHACAPYSACFSRDGRQVLTISSGHESLPPSADNSSSPVESDPDEIRAPEQNVSQGHSATETGFPPYNERETTLARVWDAKTGEAIASIGKPKGFLGKETEVPYFGHFSPDAALVALGFHDDGVQVWDVAQRKLLFKVKHGGMSGEDHAAWSPDGARLATIQGNYVSIWNAADGKELTTLRGHESTLRTLSFSPDSKLVLTTSWDRTARVWNAQTGEQVAVLRGHKSRVNAANVSPDGERVVTASEDGTVRVWRLNPPMDHARPLAEPIVNFSVMALSPDGRFLATGAHNYFNPGPRIWDTATGKLLHKLKAPREGIRAKLPDRDGFAKVQGVVFSPDGRRLLTIADEEQIKIRKSGRQPTGLLRFFAKPKPPDDADQRLNDDEDLPYTPARIWDVQTGKQLAALEAGQFNLSCACFSPDGLKVLTADSANKQYAVYSAAGAPYESGSISSTSDATCFARIYDATTGRQLLKLPHEGSILRAEFSADGRRVLTSTSSGTTPNKDIKLWDAENGTLVFGLEKASSERVACFDPAGKRIALFSRGIHIYDAQTGNELVQFEGAEVEINNWDLRRAGLSPFSPDGKLLVAYGKDGLGLTDVATGKQMVSFRGHSGTVASALFSADGRFVVTASDDRTARVWDAATGEELHVLRHQGSVGFAVMTPDDRHVATASDTVRIWDLDPLPIAVKRKARELTTEERERFGIK